MENPLLDTEAARQRLMRWKENADKRAEQTQEVAARLQELRVTVRDENATVEITVDASGAVVDVQFGYRIQRQDPEYTRRTFLEVHAEAKRQLAEAAREAVAEVLGTDSQTAQAMQGAFRPGGSVS
ncbi:YbaB/EbfC family nucleoid-associated protein [Glycomyces luteolus]|uniref:YbaB/EbfC family nucleoid-associated protein n=1 Tax=Glycomyces luteolus TaxID=2670330 RepID=A0A9X3T6P4_9ACTN|nr:YbaB/EbfC family nucleoid-associated protein [Glycomyces luteolus]MDA1363055.1 YbaB/EbfC family nucleoid-associated protein [Glycomyces luteolus]